MQKKVMMKKRCRIKSITQHDCELNRTGDENVRNLSDCAVKSSLWPITVTHKMPLMLEDGRSNLWDIIHANPFICSNQSIHQP